MQTSRSCLARYLDAADHIVTAGASLDRKSMDGDDSGFYILAGERARNEKRPRSNGAQLLRLMDNSEDPGMRDADRALSDVQVAKGRKRTIVKNCHSRRDGT